VAGGRPPLGPSIVDHLDGPDDVKKRVKVILEVLGGKRTVDEACAELGIAPARYYTLQTDLLTASIEALLPRPPGRPRQESSPEDEQLAFLMERVVELESELRAARVKEEIALTMPEVLARGRKKKRGPKRGKR
jgi:hypothetical protein